MSGDVLDILEIDRPGTPEITKESIIGPQKKKTGPKGPYMSRKPEGMAREVYALLCAENRDLPALAPTELPPGGYKNVKANLGIKRVRPWRWIPFQPRGEGGPTLHHWRRIADENKEYPFAKMNKQIPITTYSDVEYQQYLVCDAWTKAETDHLFDLCTRFDLRFPVIQDRWDREKFPTERSIEDLKDRYYSIDNALTKLRAPSGTEVQIRAFDADHERRRKYQLEKLYNRTPEEIEEEQYLINELRKIELRKKEREKKTQDLQKLITAADSSIEARRVERRSMLGVKNKKKTERTSISGGSATGSAGAGVVSGLGTSGSSLDAIETSAGIRFPDLKVGGVSLRSHRMKLPVAVGQKKGKAIEQLLKEVGVELNPTPMEETVHHFNELRSDMVLLYELKNALTTCEYELQTYRHQFQVLSAGRGALPVATIKQEPVPVPSSPSTPGSVTSQDQAFSKALQSADIQMNEELASRKRRLPLD